MTGHRGSRRAWDAELYAESCWQPAADVYRTAAGWLIKLDLAGVGPDDIRIAVSEGRLLVSGSRRDWSIADGSRPYAIEISYNRFERVFELPCDLAAVEIRSEYRDGMYLIVVTTTRLEP